MRPKTVFRDILWLPAVVVGIGTLISACSWFANSAGRRSDVAAVREPVPRTVMSGIDLPPGYQVCGVSSQQGFVWAAQRCPPREGDDVRFIVKDRPPWPCPLYGDVHPATFDYNGRITARGDGDVDIDDLLDVIRIIEQPYSDPDRDVAGDIWPCVKSDPSVVLVDVDDLSAVMAAFQGVAWCP